MSPKFINASLEITVAGNQWRRQKFLTGGGGGGDPQKMMFYRQIFDKFLKKFAFLSKNKVKKIFFADGGGAVPTP
jgi:hypothetical protein